MIFDVDLLEPLGNKVGIKQKTWKKLYDEAMKPAKEYLKNHNEMHVLNLFAYTGCATMAAAEAGATEVVHVDASKSNQLIKIRLSFAFFNIVFLKESFVFISSISLSVFLKISIF